MNAQPLKIDRKGGVIFAVLGVGGTIFLVLTAMVYLSALRNGFHWMQVVGRNAWANLQVWGGALIVVTAVAGFWLGSDRTIRLLGHLWFTEKPGNLALSIALWIGLLTVSLAAYGLMVVRAHP